MDTYIGVARPLVTVVFFLRANCVLFEHIDSQRLHVLHDDVVLAKRIACGMEPA